jgi:hypothetical protein
MYGKSISTDGETRALVAEVRKTLGLCLKMFAFSINDIYCAKYKI